MKINLKKLIMATSCLVLLFIITGCGNKTAITTTDFKSKMSNKGYANTDVISQYTDYVYIKEATVAQSTEGWQIEFYVLNDETNAQGMFNENKITFEGLKGNSSTESSTSLGNYSSYSLTSGGYYMHLCRVDNTLLFVKVPDTFKDTLKDLIKDLGY